MRYRISKALDDKQDANESEVSSSFPQLLFYPFFFAYCEQYFSPKISKTTKKDSNYLVKYTVPCSIALFALVCLVLNT